MSKALVLAIVGTGGIAAATYAICRFAVPEWTGLQESRMETQQELQEAELERDQALVDEAEREVEERRGGGRP